MIGFEVLGSNLPRLNKQKIRSPFTKTANCAGANGTALPDIVVVGLPASNVRLFTPAG